MHYQISIIGHFDADSQTEAIADFREWIAMPGCVEEGAIITREEDEDMYIVTNAPDAYDYRTTTQVGTVMTERFQELRVVRVCTDNTPYHTQYQAERYRSGLYVAFQGATALEAEQMAKRF